MAGGSTRLREVGDHNVVAAVVHKDSTSRAEEAKAFFGRLRQAPPLSTARTALDIAAPQSNGKVVAPNTQRARTSSTARRGARHTSLDKAFLFRPSFYGFPDGRRAETEIIYNMYRLHCPAVALYS
jgi:hypothetical protein